MIGKTLIALGVAMVIAGAILLTIGKLPGDFVYKRNNATFYFPLATSILLSVILTLVMWLMSKR